MTIQVASGRLFSTVAVQLAHAWIRTNDRKQHLCQHCHSLFTTAQLLTCATAETKYLKTTYYCPECARDLLSKQITHYQTLLQSLTQNSNKTASIHDMDTTALIKAFKTLPAKTLLGFLQRDLLHQHITEQDGYAHDNKIESLPLEVQTLIAGASPAIIQTAFSCCRYRAYDPALYARMLLTLFRARSKRDIKDKLKLPSDTPDALLKSTLLKLKPVSRIRILQQLKIPPPDLEQLVFPLLVQHKLRDKAVELLKKLVVTSRSDRSRIAAALNAK